MLLLCSKESFDDKHWEIIRKDHPFPPVKEKSF